MGPVYVLGVRILARRVVTPTLLAAVCVVALAPAASSHGGPQIVPILDGVVPPVAGIDVEVGGSGTAPVLTVRVTDGGRLELLDDDERPFARVGSGGAFVDTESPLAAGFELEGSGWQQTGDDPEFTYTDPRTALPEDAPMRRVVEAGERATVHEWVIPARLDGEAFHIAGRTDWVPAQFFDFEVMLVVGIIGVGAAWWVAADRVRLTRVMTVAGAAGAAVETVLAVQSISAEGPVALIPVAGVAVAAAALPLVWRGDRYAQAVMLVFGAYMAGFGMTRLLTVTPVADALYWTAIGIGTALVAGAARLLLARSTVTRTTDEAPEIEASAGR